MNDREILEEKMKITFEAPRTAITGLTERIKRQMQASRFASLSEHAGKPYVSRAEVLRAGRTPAEAGPSYRLQSDSHDSLMVSWTAVGGLAVCGKAMADVTLTEGTINLEAPPVALEIIKLRIEEALKAGRFAKAEIDEMAPATGAYFRLDDRKAGVLSVEWMDGDGLAMLGEAFSLLGTIEQLDT